jgi:nitrogen regulatory protein P-II 1
MKELKAFIRIGDIDTVIRALQAAGAPGITISHVHGVGYEYDPERFTFAPGVEGKAPAVAKIEIVCRREDVDRLVRTIVESAGSRRRGDGIVFVTQVERTVKIRDGVEGRAALAAL